MTQPSKFVKMSVVENNRGKGAFTGDNRSGVTCHTIDGSNEAVLTFNPVISVKAKNWMMLYCARPYITYSYNGKQYTDYDNGISALAWGYDDTYSTGSVFGLANLIASNPDETKGVRLFFQERIVKNKADIAVFHTGKTPDNAAYYKLRYGINI